MDRKWKKIEKDGYVILDNGNGVCLGIGADSEVPILEVDGYAFKDFLRSGELAPYEDWRLTSEERARDLAERLEIEDIVGFIENIIYTMTPVINEDTNYISRFMYYVRSFHGFNGNAIEKYISREERAVVNVLKNKAVTMQQQIMQQQTMQQQIMQQVMQGSMDGTTVLSDDGISVQQIQQMQPVNYHFASLTRQVTGEKIELGKPSFVLGKNPEKSDYAVADNTNISRVHAVITTRNGRYYVMDQNSTNGTFINGRIIKAGQETEILPGDCLMLANEEFIFNE